MDSILLICIMYRYGSGLILQAKVKLSTPTEETDSVPPRRTSLFRRVSTRLFSRRSTRRNRTNSIIHEEETEAQPPSQTSNQTNPRLHRRLTKQLTRMLSGTSNISEPQTKPQYMTASLHEFVQERFPGATKLEEHEVEPRLMTML